MLEREPVKAVVLKIANTCNISCSYCYWFKDQSVYSHSSLMKENVLNAFYQKLREHLAIFKITDFTITLHGGEPLLLNKIKMEALLFNIYKIRAEMGVNISFIMQTNGILLDNSWVDLLKSYNVAIGISIDGPKQTNDLYRLDFQGRSTYNRTIKSIQLLQSRNIPFSVLSVCNPLLSASELCDFFIDDLGIKSLDVLIPNVNYDSEDVPLIKEFYKELFRLWYTKYRQRGIYIKLTSNIFLGLQGKAFKMQSIGYSREESVMIKPDGEIEASDSLHALGHSFTKGKLNILTHQLNDIHDDALWQEVYDSSLNLHEKCMSCKFKYLCGGGHICNRWSSANRFNNPSVYCEQLYELFEAIEQYVPVFSSPFHR